MDPSGKIAAITGASKGIGRATARALARAGADVALVARDAQALEELANEVRSEGRRAFVLAGDLRDPELARRFVDETVRELGRLDVLVNNAGVGNFAPVAELTLDDWDEMFELNVRAVFVVTRAALPHLRRAGESMVVNVASLAGKNAFKGGGAYAATKHALIGFSRCLMLEERGHGVRVLAICPGSVATRFFDDHADSPDLSNVLRAQDVSECIVEAIRLPQRAMLSELDLRPTNP